jgi:DNA-binding beta-propeller fold protein YncE
MRIRSGTVVVAAFVLVGTTATTPALAATPVTATTLKTIELPGTGGHGDVVVADPAAHAVYVSQTPDNNVVVIDTRTERIKAVIGDLPGSNGIAFDHSYVYVAEQSGTVAVITKSTWQVTATVAAGGTGSDGIYDDTRDHTVDVTNDDSDNTESFGASAPFTIRHTTNLNPASPIAGPDLGVYVPETDTIYQSDDNDVDVIDARTGTVERTFTLPLPAGADAKDMYYDPIRHRLWIGTTAAEIVAVNPCTGTIVETTKTNSGMDQISADPVRRLLFLGESSSGLMGVVDLDTGKDLAEIPTEAGTHTLAHLPGTDLVYVYRNQSNVVDVVRVTGHRHASALLPA